MRPAAAPAVLHDEAAIARRVEAMANEARERLGPDMLLVPILTGAMVFAADLARALWRAGASVDVRAVRIGSYGASREAEHPPILKLPLDGRADGRAALVVDGVCDTGGSLELAVAHLKERGAGPILTAVLIDKPARRTAAIEPDLVGFEAPGDAFVVGYGMDAGGGLRHLPFVGVL